MTARITWGPDSPLAVFQSFSPEKASIEPFTHRHNSSQIIGEHQLEQTQERWTLEPLQPATGTTGGLANQREGQKALFSRVQCVPGSFCFLSFFPIPFIVFALLFSDVPINSSNGILVRRLIYSYLFLAFEQIILPSGPVSTTWLIAVTTSSWNIPRNFPGVAGIGSTFKVTRIFNHVAHARASSIQPSTSRENQTIAVRT